MSDLDLDAYCQLMQEIKRRTSVVNLILAEPGRLMFKATAVESMCLQVRKILELIAMGSLVANEEALSRARCGLGKLWSGQQILRRVHGVNPDFYPRPIVELPGSGAIKSHWENKPDGFLTEAQFAEAYARCHAVLHAENPLGRTLDYSAYERDVPLWIASIIGLLNSHTIRLAGNPNLYLIHMQEAETEQVRGYVFEQVGSLPTD
ncbi:MAG: hypothetical protein F4088_06490 [Chloroflexi bacterium]|nr:hypothetical protein [Chloroflexota bacterium]MYJ58493.1 hypothetical protein [Chloroflexota bacterium]